jgi:PAS domain S-box-containing protein
MFERTHHLLLVEQDDAVRRLIIDQLAESELVCRIDEIPDLDTFGRLAATRRQYDLVLMAPVLGDQIGADLVNILSLEVPGTPILLLVRPEHAPIAAALVRLPQITNLLPIVEGMGELLPPMVQDAIENSSARRSARQAEERFQRMAENAPDMIFRWTYARGFEYVSPASVDVVGYTPEEHYADPGLVYRNIHPDDIELYDSAFSDLADPEGPRRYLVVRWINKSEQVVHVEMRLSPIFNKNGELRAIEGIARDISQHVRTRERLRELTGRLTAAHEDERRRIAHELHDEIGQALTITKIRLRMAEKALESDDPAAPEKLSSVGALLEDTLGTVRALSHELRPPLLDEIGWEAALSWLCESFAERTGQTIHYQHSGSNARLVPEIELAAYRIVQEALTNVLRHANASEATVIAHLGDAELLLAVEDRGKGFDVGALQESDRRDAGLGLLSMGERAEAVGGHFTITSRPGQGTHVEVHLPAERQVGKEGGL